MLFYQITELHSVFHSTRTDGRVCIFLRMKFVVLYVHKIDESANFFGAFSQQLILKGPNV